MSSPRATHVPSHAAPPRMAQRRLGRGARALVALAALAAIVTLGACGGATRAVHTDTPTPMPNTGTLYFATSPLGAAPDSTTIHALSAGDGKQRWQHPVAGSPMPLVYNGTMLFLGTGQVSTGGPPSGSTLTAVTAATGATAWQHDFTTQFVRPIAATAATLFVTMTTRATSGGMPATSLAALHASDGTVIWSADVAGEPLGFVNFDGTALYVITYPPNGGTATAPPPFTLTALGASDGKPLWQFTPAGPPLTGAYGPALSGGVLYLTEQSPTPPGPGAQPSSIIEAIAVHDGTRLWQTTTPAGTAVMDLLASADGVFYTYSDYASPGGGLVALHASDGTTAWQQPLNDAGPSPALLAVDGTTVYAQVASLSAGAVVNLVFRAYDAHTGKVAYERALPSLPLQLLPKSSSPALIVGGALYQALAGVQLGTAAAQQVQCVVLGLRTSDGSAQWTHTLDGGPVSQLIYAGP